MNKHSEKKYDETLRTYNIHSKVNNFNFKISIDNWSWQGLPDSGPKAKAYYPSDENKRECNYDENSNLMCERATVTYYQSFDTFYLTPLYEYQENFVGITRNENETIDGNFDVVCTTTRDDTVHLKGSFKNLRN